MPRLSKFSLLSLIAIWCLQGCYEERVEPYAPKFTSSTPAKGVQYVFGVHPLHNPQRLFEVFSPMMEFLSDNIENVSFKLEASRDYASYDEKLYAKKFHFSLPNPYQTVKAIEQGYQVFGKMGDDENFRGIIIIRKDSGITKVTDLKNKAVSYPAPTALAATMMPQYYLQTHGIDVMTELDNQYVGSQESSIMNVFHKQTSAASTWPAPWHALIKERPELSEELKIIWETKPLINNSLVVLPTVPNEITEQVIKLLIGLAEHEQGREILARMELSKFERATNGTYSVIYEFIDVFNQKVRTIK